MSLPTGPEQFVPYFEWVNRDYPGEHWANGIAIAKRWLAMSRQEKVSQSEVDEFICRLRDEPNPGSGWTDLGYQFEDWAEHRGFRVQPPVTKPAAAPDGDE